MRPALKYNVSKKLSQLMKVIQIFETQVEERKFQKQQINSQYLEMFQQLYDEYEAISKEATESTSKIETDVKNKCKAVYEGKFISLKDDFRKTIENSQNSVQTREKEINEKLQQIQEEINNLLTSNKALTIGFESKINDIKKQLENDAKKEQEIYKKEKEAHDKEAAAKLQKLKENGEKQIKDIKEQHEKDKQELINASKNTKNLSSNKVLSNINDLKHKLEVLKQDIQKLRDTLKELQQNKNATTDENKTKTKLLAREIVSIKNKGEKDVNEKNEMKKKLESERQKETDNLIITKKENKTKHEKEIKDLEQNIKKQIEMMKQEYSQKNDEFRSKFDNLDRDIQSIIEQREKELADVRKKHAQYVEKSSETQNQLHKSILAMKDANHNEIEKFKAHIQKLETDHENLMADTKVNHLSDIEKEEKDFEAKKKELQRKYEVLIAGSNSETAKQQKQLHDILNAIDENRVKYKQEIEDFEKETENMKNKTNTNNSKELEQLKATNRQLYDKNEESDNATIEQAKSKYETAYNNEKKKLEDKYKTTMDSILKEELSNTVLSDIDADMLNKFKSLQSKHDSYVDLEVKNDEFKYLDNEIEDLRKKQQQNSTEYENTLNKNRKEFLSKIEAEKQRHLNALEKDPENDPRDDEIKSMEEQLQKKKEENKQNIEEMNAKIAAEEERHRQEILVQQKSLEQFNDTSEIDALREHIDSLRKEMEEANKQFNENEKNNEEKHKKEQEYARQCHISTLGSMQQEHDEFKKMIQSQKIEKMKEKELARQTYNENLEKADKELKDKEVEEVDQHVKDMDVLTKKFADLKAELVKNGEAFNQKFKETEKINKTAIDEIDKRKSAEFDKAKNDWNALLEFYNEKITVLTKRRNKARQMMEKRPARQQEIDEAERLQGKLQLITQNLQTAMKELTEYRVILVSKEKEYQKRFGKSPKIGVLPITHK